jgi:DnaJ-like protein
MEFFDKIVEERIQRAQEDGVFDNLPGKGKPLKLEDDSLVPEELRLTYKILKNSNCLPMEMELRKQIFNLRQLLNATIDEETRRELRRELNLLVLKFNVKQRRAIRVDLLEAPPEGLQK